MSSTTLANKTISSQTDFLPLEGTDYVEFYVGNAKQAAHYYMSAFGFQPLAYSGPETGDKEKASYAVRQHKLTFVLTTPLRPGNAIAQGGAEIRQADLEHIALGGLDLVGER